MDIKIRPCESVVEGYHYTIGKKWLYVFRGATKKYRVSLEDYHNCKTLTLLTMKNHGEVRTWVVLEYAKEQGEAL